MNISFTSRKLAVAISYLLICFNVLANMVLTPVYLRYLGTDGYGFYQMIYAVASYILILDLGIGTTMIRFISVYKEKRDKKGEECFAFYCFVLITVISILIVLAGLCVNRNLENIYRNLSPREYGLGHTMFTLMIAVLVLTVWERFFEGISMSYELFSLAKAISLFKLLFKFVLVICLLRGRLGVLSLVYADIVSLLLSMALFLYLDFRRIRFRIRYHRGYGSVIRPMSTFMLAILLQSIVSYVNNTVDKTILGVMMGKMATGIYSLAMTFITAFNMFPTAITNVFLPQATRMVLNHAGRREMTDFVIRPGRFQFMVCGGLFVGFLLFGRDFITMWAGGHVREIWLISVIIMVPNMIILVQNTILSILDAKNKRLFRSVVILGISVLNIVLTIYMVGKIGAIGAPLATAVSYVAGYIIIMNVYYSRVIGIEVFRMFREIFRGIGPSLLIAGICSVPVLLVWHQISILKFIAEGLIFMAVYGLALFLYGMNQEEKSLVTMLIAKVRKR